MPLGKYYCDYCEKQFQDTPAARKRHLQGVQHQRARALWYDSLIPKPTNQTHQSDGLARGLCNRFLRTGFCHYADSCKYLHPKQPILNATSPNIPVVNYTNTIQLPVTGGNQFVGGSSLQGNIGRDGMRISLGNLPLSLRLPPEGGYPSLPFVDWG
ncbi:hypothetical protein Sjap_007206 [Stephania japonica]|uniref:C3H1-type domain-containing protein n=1 Tax=Stephania japonica TaxID=461633 RepID=A0AAP0PA77_9MAGN